MVIQHGVYKGYPGLYIAGGGKNITVRDCVFLNWQGRKKITMEDLILAEGRWLGGTRLDLGSQKEQTATPAGYR